MAATSGYTGYGLHLSHLVRGLKARGYFPSIRRIKDHRALPGVFTPPDVEACIVKGVQPEEWEILLAPPHHCPTAGKKTLFFTMYEATRLPKRSVELLNKATVVSVPCLWCKENFIASGVTVPIHVVPLGIDPKVFYPSPMKMDGPCVFGTAGRLAHGRARKGVHSVIEAFKAAFRHDEKVELHVKVHPDCDVGDIVDPRIKVTKAHLTETQIANWLRNLTCFVSGATGEGWGLWQQQALTCGRPLIAAQYGGLREYFGIGMGCPVEYTEEPAREGFAGNGNWAEPDLSHMVAAMQEAAKNRLALGEAGLNAALRAPNFTWAEHVANVIRIIEGNAVPEYKRPAIIESAPKDHGSWSEQCDRLGWESGIIDIPCRENEVVFNPGLLRSGDGYNLFARRGRVTEAGDVVDNSLECWRLDNLMRPQFFNPLELGDGEPEDARAMPADNGGFLLSYAHVSADTIKSKTGKIPTQRIALFDELFNVHGIVTPQFGNNGDGVHMEKNWTPFNWRDQACFVYHIEPHTVFQLMPGGVSAPSATKCDLSFWKWGRPLGGTPPILIDGEYFSLFHSRLPWKRDRRKYFVGAYAFEARPPFRITRFTREPILYGYPSDLEKPRPIAHCLIYPVGADVKGDEWTVTAGVNDELAIWMRFRTEDLLSRMAAIF